MRTAHDISNATKFGKEQLILVVNCMIGSFVSMITSSFPAMPETDPTEEEIKLWNTFKKQESPSDPPTFLSNALWHLGWNLSILYAQVTDDGMGESDALDLDLPGEPSIRTQLEKWANDFIDGKIGFIRAPKGASYAGSYRLPGNERLAELWVETVFDEYLNT